MHDSASIRSRFAPRNWPFFYGWVVLAAATIGTIASLPGQTMGVGVFSEDLERVLSLSSLQLATAYALGTITSSFMLPYAGVLLDRFGARRMVVLSSMGLGLSLVLLSVSDKLAALGGFLISLIVSYLVFFGLRFFGQGCLALVARVMIGKWFNRLRGRATAISGVFVGFSFNGGMIAINWLVQSMGWRGAALLLAGLVGGGMSLIGWLFYRDNPEEQGLEMDGGRGREPDPGMPRKPPVHEYTRDEARRTLAFWAYSFAPATQGLIVTAVFFHLAALGEYSGIDRDAAYAIFLPMPFISVPVSLIGGWMADRADMRWLLCAMMLGQGIGSAGLLFLDTLWGQALMVAGYGLAGGLFGIILTVSFPRFFGREHLGAISGLNMSILVFSSALGPIFFSVIEWFTGDYQWAILLSLAMPFAVLAMGLPARDPQDLAAERSG